MLTLNNKIIDVVKQSTDSASFGEKMVLYSLMMSTNTKIAVEVGTHRGHTSLFMAHALYDLNKIELIKLQNLKSDNEMNSNNELNNNELNKNISFRKLITCDPYSYDQQETFDKIPELGDYIEYHQQKGEHLYKLIEDKKIDLKGQMIDFIFIDGFHEYECVVNEVKTLYKYLSPKGLIVFHDCGGDNAQVGVNRAIKDMGLQTVLIPTTNYIRVFCKDSNIDNYIDKKQMISFG